jgi:gamma-glutamyl hercynylcysteine S-oxide synthase
MTVASPVATLVDRNALVARYRAARQRTHGIFDIPSKDAYFERPIPLRHPFVFYEGHLPAFIINTLIKGALGKPGIDERLEVLFARGIDPEDERAAVAGQGSGWPSRAEVLAYGRAADEIIERALREADLESDDNPMLRRGEAALAVLEHEFMHQETLHYILHELPYSRKQTRHTRHPSTDRVVVQELIDIPAGAATLGTDHNAVDFFWDNEFPTNVQHVPRFAIQKFNVTNNEYLDFVGAGGYANQSLWSPEAWRWLEEKQVRHPHFWLRSGDAWLWRGLFEAYPLPPHGPVYVTHAEASAYAQWAGRRLPTEAEYHRAAFGTPEGTERLHPWGDEAPSGNHGNFGFRAWDPVAVGSFPAGASAWGVEDLVGNGWEWTSTPFAPFDGFAPMASYPVYSTDFFDGQHFVLKGASPVTDDLLVRRSFRNWFRPIYPYIYATFRCVRD